MCILRESKRITRIKSQFGLCGTVDVSTERLVDGETELRHSVISSSDLSSLIQNHKEKGL